jgi:hypothetical protein
MTRIALHPLYDPLLPEILAEAEGGKTGLVVALDNANSGLSVGRYQMDLSQRRDLAAELAQIARKGDWAEETDIDLIDRRTRDLLPDERRRAETLVRRLIERGEGFTALARAETLKLLQLRKVVLRLCAGAPLLASEFLGGLRGQVELACHLHQYGSVGTARLEKFLHGETVRFYEASLPPREATAGDPLDLAGFRRFREATKWGHLHERARLSRDVRVDRAYAVAIARVTGGDPNTAGLEGVPDPVRRVFERDAASRGVASAIKRLQRVLNAVLTAEDAPSAGVKRLAIDGAWGPLCIGALRVVLRFTGSDGMALAKRVALDAADDALRAAKRGDDPVAIETAHDALAALGPDAALAIRLAAGRPRVPSGPDITRAALADLVVAVGPAGLAAALYGQAPWRALDGERSQA